MSEANDATLDVNGESVSGYVLGDGSQKSIFITGLAKEMINALDVGFYASVWEGRRGAMTLNNMNLELMYNGALTPLYQYKPLEDALKAEVKGDFSSLGSFLGGIAEGAAVGLVMQSLKSGIPRDKESELTFLYLTKFIAAETITFNKNIIENGATAISDKIFILDEGPIHKQIKASTIDSFMGSKFKYTESGVTYIPTYQGLYDIVNNTDSSEDMISKNGQTYRYNTSYSIFNKLMTVLGNKTISVTQSGMTVSINLGNILKAFFDSIESLETMLQTMKVKLEIATYPYDSSSETYNPIILWGLDVYGPNASAPTSETTEQ